MPAGAAPASGGTVTVFVCITCRSAADPQAAGAGLHEAVRASSARDGIVVKGVRCLAGCKRGLTAALTRSDGWTYVFGDLTPCAAPDLIAGARLLAASHDGLLPWRGRPEPLKRGMLARIPPLTFIEDAP